MYFSGRAEANFVICGGRTRRGEILLLLETLLTNYSTLCEALIIISRERTYP
jgi:hypothetical protein